MKDKLLMISLDNVDSHNINTLFTLPNCKQLLNKGTLVKDVDTVYVSNTYPIHTTIATGVLPNKHGITENIYFKPKINENAWRVDANDIKVPTIFSKFKEYYPNKTSCALFYPVTGKANIDYLFAEIPDKLSAAGTFFKILKYSSKAYVLGSAFKYAKLLKKTVQPYIDDFVTAIAVDTIKNKKTDFTAVHLSDTDHQKHKYGINSTQVEQSLHRQDERIGKLLKTLEDSSQIDNTSVLICSDHSCLDVNHNLTPNKDLEDAGYIPAQNINANKADAYFHYAGGSAFFKINNQEKRNQLMEIFYEYSKKPEIYRTLTDKEMSESGLDSFFDCGLVASEGYNFSDSPYKGQHGYTLDCYKNKPFYFALGDNIPKGVELSGGSLMDICPLMCDFLKIPYWNFDESACNYIYNNTKGL